MVSHIIVESSQQITSRTFAKPLSFGSCLFKLFASLQECEATSPQQGTPIIKAPTFLRVSHGIGRGDSPLDFLMISTYLGKWNPRISKPECMGAFCCGIFWSFLPPLGFSSHEINATLVVGFNPFEKHNCQVGFFSIGMDRCINTNMLQTTTL